MIGDYIRQRRKELGLTQTELGDRIGVSQRTVSRWEGRETLPRSKLDGLAKGLEVDVETLEVENDLNVERQGRKSRPTHRGDVLTRDLKQLRSDAGLDAEDIADEVGVPAPEYRRWEEKDEVPEPYIRDLAYALGERVGELSRMVEFADMGENDDRVFAWTDQEVNQWRSMVIEASRKGELLPEKVSEEVRAEITLAMLAIPMPPFWNSGFSSFTVGDLAKKAGISAERLKEWWPQVLRTDFVERVGSGRWAVRLVIPKRTDDD